MDLPASAYIGTIDEGKMYFFKADCPIGVKDHIHICIKRGETVLLFATGSSQVEKAIARANALGFDLNSYPVFLADSINQLRKPQTYINCNQPIEVTHNNFAKLLKEGKVYELPGIFEAESLTRIIEGVKCSKLVENRIKEML